MSDNNNFKDITVPAGMPPFTVGKDKASGAIFFSNVARGTIADVVTVGTAVNDGGTEAVTTPETVLTKLHYYPFVPGFIGSTGNFVKYPVGSTLTYNTNDTDNTIIVKYDNNSIQKLRGIIGTEISKCAADAAAAGDVAAAAAAAGDAARKPLVFGINGLESDLDEAIPIDLHGKDNRNRVGAAIQNIIEYPPNGTIDNNTNRKFVGGKPHRRITSKLRPHTSKRRHRRRKA